MVVLRPMGRRGLYSALTLPAAASGTTTTAVP
jgi:hypothetical protein